MKFLPVAGAAVGTLLLAACLAQPTGPTCYRTDSVVTETRGDTVVTASGLRYIPSQTGTGAEARLCSHIKVHYTGYLVDGRQFDTSRDEDDEPLGITLGAREVILGWEQGLLGMRVGGTRRLIVPPHLAYGNNPPRGTIIRPGDTLIFDVELVEVRR